MPLKIVGFDLETAWHRLFVGLRVTARRSGKERDV